MAMLNSETNGKSELTFDGVPSWLIVAGLNVNWHRTVVYLLCPSARCAIRVALYQGRAPWLPGNIPQPPGVRGGAHSGAHSASCRRVHLDLDGEAEDGGEERREEILVHSVLAAIMNALSGRIHQRSLWGEEMSGKVMVCWLLTHVAEPGKVIEVQKMSCCCTSSICIAVSQNK